MEVVEWLKQTIFARQLVEDIRTVEANAIFSLEVPSALWRASGIDNNSTTTCSLLPPDFGFYYQLVAVVLFQSLFNAILGYFVYKVMVESQTTGKKNNDSGVSVVKSLFAYGIALPCVVFEPIYAIQTLEIRNAGIIMVFLATPIVNSLRITEALYGFAPAIAQSNARNYVFYFSCLFGMEFDSSKNQPKHVTKDFLFQRLGTLGRDFVIVSLLISVLAEYDYEFFDTNTDVDSMDHTLSEMFSWMHLFNNFFVAMLISCSLSQSSLGVSLIYNLLYRVQTYEVVLNPMLKSKSPTDFWGRRWNMLVHKGLKNGIYKPTRKHTSSKLWAVVATFVVSGIIHEYVNYVMFIGKWGNRGIEDAPMDYRFQWKQMIFFGWNGILILLEYTIGHWGIFQWLSKSLPPIAKTGLVLCCALPLAHLFTGDWIKIGYFDSVFLAEPIIVCR